jgi:putative transposase
VENPRYYRTSQKTLRRKQRMIARRKKGSHRRRKAARSTAQTHLKVSRQRRDFHYKTAKRYTEQHRVIAVEKLSILNMVQNHSLAKSILDASWGAFLDILEEKAERAGHRMIRVNPRFTSQKCHKCGEIVQKSLSVRTHICPCCGYVADRDVNAAQNILSLAGARPSGVKHPDGDVSLRSPLEASQRQCEYNDVDYCKQPE